jgi:hypothetical protein
VAALCTVLCLCAALCARAGVIDAPARDLEVSLVTYGPGAIYWERFGHDAIQLRDPSSGESADFNYGVFDFEDNAFLWNFARGYMRYMIDIQPSDSVQQGYIDEGRSVVEQRLALSAAQAESLRAFLIWNLRPENVGYNYDYLTDNCATRVRDALNSALGGALQAAFTTHPAPMTYRQQIDRLMSAQPWVMVGMDLGLGPFADHPLTEWQESFLPLVLAREMRSIRIPDGRGGVKPLVVSERQIAPNRLKPPATTPPDLNIPLGIAGLALAVTMLVSRRRLPILQAAVSIAYLVLVGIVGTLLLVLWTLTMHHAAWGSRNRVGGNRLSRTLVAIQVGAALFAVVLHFLGATSQQNLPWLLFSIPVWIAVAVGLWT